MNSPRTPGELPRACGIHTRPQRGRALSQGARVMPTASDGTTVPCDHQGIHPGGFRKRVGIMASLRKLIKRESAAYTASQRATQAVVVARLDSATEQEIARLSRRAAAFRAQWLGLASTLELIENQRVYA